MSVTFVAVAIRYSTATHFLGDGYLLLGSLVSPPHVVKLRSLVASLPQEFMLRLLGERNFDSALTSYRLVAYAVGFLFAGLSVWVATKEFRSTIARVLFLLSMLSGGYALLFFGYVENYALFANATLAVCAVGILVVTGSIRWYWLVLAYLFAQVMHIFGAVFLPAVLLALLYSTSLGRKVLALPPAIRLVLIAVTVVGLSIAAVNMYLTNFFFRFSLIPPVNDSFTADGYSLFSLPHLLDYANLLFVLVPAVVLLLFSGTIKRKQSRQSHHAENNPYLLMAVLCAALAAFVFDPNLGMPRDWDLFAFAGIPLLFLLSLRACRLVDAGNVPARNTVLLAITLNVLILSARVMVFGQESASVAYINDTVRLDPAKNRNTYQMLSTYYVEKGDSAMAAEYTRKLQSAYPERAFCIAAENANLSGNYQEALYLSKQALSLNPSMWDGYANLGVAYMGLNMPDTGIYYLNVADGLNPYNADVLASIGVAYLQKQDLEQARKWSIRAHEIDPQSFRPLMTLAFVEFLEGNTEQSLSFMDRAAAARGADALSFYTLATVHLSGQQYAPAGRALTHALRLGIDTLRVRELISRFPQLQAGNAIQQQ